MPWLILVGGAIGVTLGLGRREQETRRPVAVETVLRVGTVPIRQHVGTIDIEVDGVVQPFREIEVTAEVNGRVLFKADECKAGCFVRSGTSLVEIDPADYRLELQRYERHVEQAHSELEENEVEWSNLESLLALAQRDLQLQRNDMERIKALSEGNSISRSELDRAEGRIVAAESALQLLQNQRRVAEARRQRLRSGVEVASSLVERARLDLNRTKLHAPVDGVIVQDSVEQDGYAQKGQALFVIEDISSVEVQCSLQLRDVYWLWRQQTATSQGEEPLVERAYQIPQTEATVIARIAGLPDLRFSWQGLLMRYDGIGLDERTRTVPCRVSVNRPREFFVLTPDGRQADSQAGPPALIRGMFVTVVLHAKPPGPFVLVHEDAVQPGKIVWRVRQGRLERVGPLTLVGRVEQREADGTLATYWIASGTDSGLSVADQLVVEPLGGLQPGAQVTAQVVNRELTSRSRSD